jgi:hypothetical protein
MCGCCGTPTPKREEPAQVTNPRQDTRDRQPEQTDSEAARETSACC